MPSNGVAYVHLQARKRAQSSPVDSPHLAIPEAQARTWWVSRSAPVVSTEKGSLDIDRVAKDALEEVRLLAQLNQLLLRGVGEVSFHVV